MTAALSDLSSIVCYRVGAHCKSEGVGLPSVQTIDLPMAFMRLMDSRVYSSRPLFCSLVDSGGLERLVMERGMPYSVCFTPTSTVTKEIIQFAMECPSIHIPHTPTIPIHVSLPKPILTILDPYDHSSSLFHLWKGIRIRSIPHFKVVGNKWEAYLHYLEDENMDAAYSPRPFLTSVEPLWISSV